MTLVLPYLYLAVAIVFEVIGTSALKASDTFTRLVPSLVTLTAYAVSFTFLALSLRAIPVGIAYAIWAGVGIVLIALVGWLWFKQPLDGPAGPNVAVKGKTNTIKVRVHNRGTKAANAVQVRVQWLPFTSAPGPWIPLANPATQPIRQCDVVFLRVRDQQARG